MTPETSDKTFSQKARAAIGGFAASAQAATQLAAKQAERTKLTNVTLPHAYRELGTDIHATGRYRDQFPDKFAKADELKGRIAGLRQAVTHKEGEAKSFTDRAKETAGKARDAAHAKTLEIELSSVLRKLGRAAFEKLGKGSGAPALTGPIEQCQQRLATLDAEIQAIDSSATSGVLTPRRLLVGAGVVAVLVLCLGAWAMFGGGGSEPQVAGIPKSGLKSAQTPVTDEVPTGVPDVGDVVGDARSRLGDMTRRIEEHSRIRDETDLPPKPASNGDIPDETIDEPESIIKPYEIPAAKKIEPKVPVVTLSRVRTFDIETDRIKAIEFSSDGQLVAISTRSASAEGTVFICDTATGRQKKQIRTGLQGIVTNTAGNPMTMTDDATMLDGQRLGAGDLHLPCGFVKLARKGTWIITDALNGTDGTLVFTKLWNVETERELRVFRHRDGAKPLAVSHDGRWLITSSNFLWDMNTGEWVRRFEGHEDDVVCAAFTPDNQQAITGSMDGTAIIWDVATGRELHAFHRQARLSATGITSVAFSKDGKRAMTATNGMAFVWDASTGQTLHGLHEQSWRLHPGEPYRRIHCRGPMIPSPDGKWIVIGSERDIPFLWDATRMAPVRALEEFEGVAGCPLVFSPDSEYLLAGTNPVSLWKLTVSGLGPETSDHEEDGSKQTTQSASETAYRQGFAAGTRDANRLLQEIADSRDDATLLGVLRNRITSEKREYEQLTQSLGTNSQVGQLAKGRYEAFLEIVKSSKYASEVLPNSIRGGETGRDGDEVRQDELGEVVQASDASPRSLRIRRILCNDVLSAPHRQKKLVNERDQSEFRGVASIKASRVLTAAVSEDGGRALVAAEDGIYLWDLRSKKQIAYTPLFGLPVVLSPDARYALHVSPNEDSLTLWDSNEAGKPSVLQLTPDQSGKTPSFFGRCVFDRDGTHAMLSYMTTELKPGMATHSTPLLAVWDLTQRREVARFPGYDVGFLLGKERAVLANSDTSRAVLSDFNGNTLHTFAVRRLRSSQKNFYDAPPPPHYFRLSGNEKRFLSLSETHDADVALVEIFDVETGKRLSSITQESNAQEILDFSHDGSRLLTGSNPSTLEDLEELLVWSTESGELLFRLNPGQNVSVEDPTLFDRNPSVGRSCFSKDGKSVLVANNLLRLWKLDESKRIQLNTDTVSCQVAGTPSLRDVTVLGVRAGDRGIYTAGAGGLECWEMPEGEKGVVLDDPAQAQASEGESALSVEFRQCSMSFQEKRDWRCVAISPDGNMAALGGGHGEGVLVCLDVSTGKTIRSFGNQEDALSAVYRHAHDDCVNQLAFSPDGHFLASLGKQNDVKVWDVSTGDLVQTWPVYGGARSIAFAGDSQTLFAPAADPEYVFGNIFALGCRNGTNTQLLALKSMLKNPQGRLDGVRWTLSPDAPVALLGASTVAVSPSGEHLAYGATDGVVRVWSFQENRVLTRLPVGNAEMLEKEIVAMAFMPDGRTLLSAHRTWGKDGFRGYHGTHEIFGSKGRVVQWDIDTGAQLHEWEVENVMSAHPISDGLGVAAFCEDHIDFIDIRSETRYARILVSSNSRFPIRLDVDTALGGSRLAIVADFGKTRRTGDFSDISGKYAVCGIWDVLVSPSTR